MFSLLLKVELMFLLSVEVKRVFFVNELGMKWKS